MSTQATPRPSDPFAINLDCIHCGLCLSKCPTYQVLGTEPDSPRGRIYLMKALQDGRIGFDAATLGHLDGCLGCRACESACPSGVRYEHMLVETRALIRRRRPPGRLARLALGFLGRPRLLSWSFALLRPIHRVGLVGWFASNRWTARAFPGLARAASKLTAPTRPWKPGGKGAAHSDAPRVGFLTGCVMPHLLPRVHQASEGVLRLLGYQLEVPSNQVCCGALHYHAGNLDGARRLAIRNLRAFAGGRKREIVVNSAGCGAFLKEYGILLADTPLASQAKEFSASIRDICEFVDEKGGELPPGRLSGRVAYDDACHLLHGQRIGRQPRNLLRRISGLELVEPFGADRCCGAAGDYNLHQPEMADHLRDRKAEELLEARPDWVATANPGCILQIAEGLAKAGSRVPVVHPIELVWMAAASKADN